MNEILIQQYGIFLIGAGLSIVLFLLLFLVLRRNTQKKKGLRPNAEAAAMAAAALENEAQNEPHIETGQEPIGPSSDEEMPDAEKGSGFQFMRRQRKKAKDNQAQDSHVQSPIDGQLAEDNVASADSASDDLKRITDIEQQMLAIREMFRQGEISRSVYVAETKALYETAQLVKPS